ncbi:hypothetical protein [Bradyrhizobium valentinum]|uniref:Uncharacterized protein n=1 Tax=Bradyrhizobium valentinum TaxID=1518501 RepID=A0A0R3KWS5_9BRAD|nr:hypothetical protein [Bradyrhizobium valentinum]KRQ99245.1 hypothetical protein CP49_11650 [Bradyrhizobium valentinum]
MKRTKYAVDTKVPVPQTRIEIETTLARFGATAFAYAVHETGASIAFECNSRRIRFSLPLTKGDDARTQKHHRERWRALFLTIKSKLVSIDSGIETFEDAFMPHIVMPTGQTVSETIRPQIADAYKGGRMPLLLTGPT